jgi:limonene-1,2-epoxide hydrolase
MGEHEPMQDGSSETVVRGFCAAVPSLDADKLRPFLSDSVVYHNIPMDPAVGLDATMAVLEMFISMSDALEFRIDNLAVNGNVVLTERVDIITINGKATELPVMGTFEVLDGRITAWRDYFDMAQITAALAGG